MTYDILADSSFYICYLDDINNCEALNKIIDKFDFYLTNIIKSEICSSKNYNNIEKNQNLKDYSPFFHIEKILEPFFSKEEIRKGEHEIMAYSFLWDYLNIIHFTIIDDEPARKFIEKNIPIIIPYMNRTARFTADCYVIYSIFSKEYALYLLDSIDKSNFRIKNEHIIYLKKYVEEN